MSQCFRCDSKISDDVAPIKFCHESHLSQNYPFWFIFLTSVSDVPILGLRPRTARTEGFLASLLECPSLQWWWWRQGDNDEDDCSNIGPHLGRIEINLECWLLPQWTEASIERDVSPQLEEERRTFQDVGKVWSKWKFTCLLWCTYTFCICLSSEKGSRHPEYYAMQNMTILTKCLRLQLSSHLRRQF